MRPWLPTFLVSIVSCARQSPYRHQTRGLEHDARRGIYLGYSHAISPCRSILTNLISEREFPLFPYRIRSHSAITDTMAADFSRSHRLLRQTITLADIRHGRGCIRVRGKLGRERLQYGHGTAALQAADAYVLQTLVSAYDGGHKRSALAEGYEVGFEEHCKWPT